MRHTCVSCFQNQHVTDFSSNQLPVIQEYAAALSECLPYATSIDPSIEFSWKWTMKVDYASPFYSGGLQWELQNVLLNLAILQAYEASKASSATQNGPSNMKSAVLHLQLAATLANYLSEIHEEDLEVLDDSRDLSKSYFAWLEHYLLGEAQRFSYTTMIATFRQPKHFLLAKVAAACVPLYQSAVNANLPSEPHHDVARAWGMYFDAVSEFHQALAHSEKQEPAACFTRLTAALRFASLCKGFCDNCNPDNEIVARECSGLTAALIEAIEDRLPQSEQQCQGHDKIIDRDELAEIEPKRMVELTKPRMSTLFPPLSGPPLFGPVTVASTEPLVDRGVPEEPSNRNPVTIPPKEAPQEGPQVLPLAQNYQTWKGQQLGNVEALAQWVQEQTDAARHALSLVDLPHSLTAYRQRAIGGGIPLDLWKRVEEVQITQKDERLKSQLWHLRDDSEKALRIYQDIQSQLEEDRERDRLFRAQHVDFPGHDVLQVQVPLRKALDKYSKLMSAAQDSDRVLADQLQILESDPKFRLLKFQKSQLDHLLPPSAADDVVVDESELSRCLVQLSERLEERDAQVTSLQDYVTDTVTRLDGVAAGAAPGDESPELLAALQSAAQHVNQEAERIQNSVEDQRHLLHQILQLNQTFIEARHETSATDASANVLIKLEDALEELDEFTSHLTEGTDFYNVIVPKLELLRHNVGDVSTRLEVERCEYEERFQRARQEEADKRLAEEMADPSRASNNGGGGLGTQTPTSPSQPSGRLPQATAPVGMPNGGTPPPPGVEQVSHVDGPTVRVDDEKVANLVAMGFDPEQVVSALRRCDNNVDQALNNLLGG